MHQSTTTSLSQTFWPRWASRQFPTLPIVQNLLPVAFGYSLSSEAVVMRQLRRWKRLWRRSWTHLHKWTSMGHSSSCWNGTTRRLLRRRLTFQVCTINKTTYTKKVLKLIKWSSYIYIYIYIWKMQSNTVRMCQNGQFMTEERFCWKALRDVIGRQDG